MGGFIVAAIGEAFAASFAGQVVAFAINMVASSILSKVFAPDTPNQGSQQAQPNPGNRQQLSPAGDNKLPVVYGSAYVGGIITDLTISENNQDIYWVMSLCEVTNTENGGTGDNITFGNVYWGGKKCIFGSNGAVTGLLDESTNETQDVSGYMDIYLYKNGSNQPANTSSSAITILSASNLVYQWDSTKLMSNCAFAIVHLKYNQDRNLTALNQTRFQVINSRKNTGDCFLDYLSSERYGAAIPLSQIDTNSLSALTTYSNELVPYTPSGGGTSYMKRFEFNGTLNTNQKIMQNIQSMADSCDCLVRYSEIDATWGVVIQSPVYTVAMDLNDSNIISAITVTPIDLSNSFNIIECKFPDGTEKDSFNTVNLDLSVVAPSLLFPNEPVNKQSLNLYLVNNSVTAQLLANRMLKAAREDLQIMFDINYVGLQLEAGDIVTVTNANYGWTAKPFRIIKVIQKFTDDGKIYASLNLTEFNADIYSDLNVTAFTPAPNTGIGSPTAFGIVPAPTITNSLPSIANPAFSVSITTSSAGITQYAEVWYSAYQYPTDSQRIFAGITEVNANGNPYNINTAMPPVQLFNIPAGNWYFFSRMVNALASSQFSLASTVFNWRPTTFQFTDRYLSVAYADDITGAGFSLTPTNKLYYGLLNQSGNTPSLLPSSYNWYLADPSFDTNKYLVYTNRTGRKFSFDTDFAVYAAGSGAFVPSSTNKFDQRIWSAQDPASTQPNIIDLDHSTGQVTTTGTTTVGTGQVKVVNTTDGQIVASLDQFLDFGGATTYSGSATSITVDIYGRVVGFGIPDDAYMTFEYWNATSGQTTFTPATRGTGYVTGQDLIFQNGMLLSTSDYSETDTDFTLNVGATLNDVISCISFRAHSIQAYYEPMNIVVASTAGNSMIWNAAQMPYQLINAGDKITFTKAGTPTQYTVSTVNYATRTITFTSSLSGVSTGDIIYRYRAAGSYYPVFSRWEFDLANASTYTPTTWRVHSGYELLFLSGTVMNEQDYDIVSGAITNFPNLTTGKMVMIQFGQNNLGTPIGSLSNVVTYTSNGQVTYSYTYTANSFNLFANGSYLEQSVDYTTATSTYTLTVAPLNNTTNLLNQIFASAGPA